GTMRNENVINRTSGTVVDDDTAVFFGHIETVDHHQRFDIDIKRTPPTLKHLLEVSVLEIKFTCNEVVLLIKSSAGDKYLDHGAKVKQRRRVTPPSINSLMALIRS